MIGLRGFAAAFSAHPTLGTAAAPLVHGTGHSLALVMGPSGIPLVNAKELAATVNLYLAPLGFSGTAQPLYTPEGSTIASYTQGQADLITAVTTAHASGAYNTANPIWIFGYSQSAAIASAVMSTLSQQGIPSTDLRFVLVGNPASAYGGFLNVYPWLAKLLGYTPLTTPNNLYPTWTYTIPGDGYADDTGVLVPNVLSMEHEQYWGVTNDDVAKATLAHTDGMAKYYTLRPANSGAALWNSLIISLG